MYENATWRYMPASCAGELSNNTLNFVLLIKNDLSYCTWIDPCESADSDVPKNSLPQWKFTFEGILWIVSDQGLHFTTSLMKSSTKTAHILHHFITTYWPCAKSTVKRRCEEVNAGIALLSEWKRPMLDWLGAMEAIHSMVNQSTLEKLGRNSDERGCKWWNSPMGMFNTIEAPEWMNWPSHFLK